MAEIGHILRRNLDNYQAEKMGADLAFNVADNPSDYLTPEAREKIKFEAAAKARERLRMEYAAAILSLAQDILVHTEDINADGAISCAQTFTEKADEFLRNYKLPEGR